MVLSLIGTGYVEGIPGDSSRALVVDAGLAAFYASAWILRKKRPKSRRVLEYARRAYRLFQWTSTVAAAAIARIFLPLTRFVGTLDVVQNTALLVGIVVFVTLIGNVTSIADIFKKMEEEMVKKFEADNPPQ